MGKISLAFNIFVLIPVQKMVYLKAIRKINPKDVSVSGTIDQKTYLKKFIALGGTMGCAVGYKPAKAVLK